MWDNQIILEAVASSNPDKAIKHYTIRTVLCWIIFGIAFLMMAGGSISAAITQIWSLFILTGIGFFLVALTPCLAAFYMHRRKEAKRFKVIYQYISSKDQHLIVDLGKVFSLDQNGVLYLIRRVQEIGGFSDYHILYDIFLTKNNIEISKEEILRLSKEGHHLGKINFNGEKKNCPYCNISIDYGALKCPYCGKDL